MSSFNYYYNASAMFQDAQDYGQSDSQLPEPAQEARAEGTQLTDEEMADMLKSFDLLNVPQHVMIQNPENLIPNIQVDPQFQQPLEDPLRPFLSKAITDRLNLITEMESKNTRLKEAKEVLEEKIANAVNYQRDLDSIIKELSSNQTSLAEKHTEVTILNDELVKINNPPLYLKRAFEESKMKRVLAHSNIAPEVINQKDSINKDPRLTPSLTIPGTSGASNPVTPLSNISPNTVDRMLPSSIVTIHDQDSEEEFAIPKIKSNKRPRKNEHKTDSKIRSLMVKDGVLVSSNEIPECTFTPVNKKRKYVQRMK